MVALKWLFITAVTTGSVLAQAPPTGDETIAADYWNGINLDSTAGGNPPEKRDATIVKVPRNSPPAVMKDPYQGSFCLAPFTKPPSQTKCNRNNCFRGLLNARDGSDGKHCPKEAFAFCCAYNFADDFTKYTGVKLGLIQHLAPYTENCKDSGDSIWDVVNKLNDACGCTLDHEVTIDVTSDYFKLRFFPPFAPQCH